MRILFFLFSITAGRFVLKFAVLLDAVLLDHALNAVHVLGVSAQVHVQLYRWSKGYLFPSRPAAVGESTAWL